MLYLDLFWVFTYIYATMHIEVTVKSEGFGP